RGIQPLDLAGRQPARETLGPDHVLRAQPARLRDLLQLLGGHRPELLSLAEIKELRCHRSTSPNALLPSLQMTRGRGGGQEKTVRGLPRTRRPGRHFDPSSVARRVAASTASIRAARSPPRSRACSPAIVVPPGLATASFRAPGCWPVSSTSFAEP